MKLLPKTPDIHMEIAGMEASLLGRASVDDSRYVNSIYQAMYAAAPEVKDAPVAWRQRNRSDRFSYFDPPFNPSVAHDNGVPYVALYTHPSPRIAALEAEVAKLREILRGIEFGSNSYCPRCHGWMASPNGCTPKAHSKDCDLAKALK